MDRAIILSDRHEPFGCKIDKVLKIIRKERPKIVIDTGDFADFYTSARFAPSHIYINPRDEFNLAKEKTERFWHEVKAIVPRSRMILLAGNHYMRPTKRIREMCPELESMLDIKKVMDLPFVEFYEDERVEVDMGDYIACHGWLSTLGQHARYFNKSVIHGHSHRAGLVYLNTHEKTIWEMEVGFLADTTKLPLQYTKTTTTQWIHACGMVDDYGPRIIAL